MVHAMRMHVYTHVHSRAERVSRMRSTHKHTIDKIATLGRPRARARTCTFNDRRTVIDVMVLMTNKTSAITIKFFKFT